MRTGLLLAVTTLSAVKACPDATHFMLSSPLQSAILQVPGNSLPGLQREVRHDYGH
jgi:hypothetical protein